MFSPRSAPLFAFVPLVVAMRFALLNDPRKMPS